MGSPVSEDETLFQLPVMNPQDPQRVARKPVRSRTSQSHASADDQPHAGRAGFRQDSGEQVSRVQPHKSHSRQSANQEGHLLSKEHNLTADDEKTARRKDESKAQAIRRSYIRLSYRTWLWECLSCVSAGSLLCAIIIVLAVYSGKPLPQLPFSISLNTVVSLLATALKAALIIPVAACISQLKWYWYRQTRSLSDIATYDEASRGPYGAFVLVCSPRLRGLATMGAILTILAVAIDPFTQQIIRYRPCASTHSNATAAVLRASNYSASGGYLTSGSQTYEYGMDLEMQAAIYQGAYGLPSNVVNLLGYCR